ncbi:transporter substrate-binding domain-containing protein [Alteromonas sp. ALT199]|uniref:transporter substrate-binding domain-containing protein n=1 Tax=unclassified Alteromonas TaxID=2614992 RepID=UPI001BECF857|nr:transporter substrate-binding domain-containing protein [Alteromonas sp. ALT199]MBT3133974.1 transporter substrate-binding domain-containing protein [Alteromonas sp. ALT199]
MFRSICTYLLLIVCSSAFASPNHVYFLSEVTPPYYWYDNNGKPQGVNVDLANALKPLLPFSSSLAHMPWARAYHETLEKPNLVLLSLLKTPKRENQFEWLAEVNHVQAALIRLKRKDTTLINSLNDAKSFRVGSIRGYASALYLQQHGFKEKKNLALVTEPEQLWKLLYKERIDFALANFETGKYEISDAGFNPDDATSEYVIDALGADLFVATGLKTDKDKVKSLKNALSILKANGEYARILKKWGLEPIESAQ